MTASHPTYFTVRNLGLCLSFTATCKPLLKEIIPLHSWSVTGITEYLQLFRVLLNPSKYNS